MSASLLVLGFLFKPWWVDSDWRWICLLALPYLANVDWKWLLAIATIPSAAMMKGVQFAPEGISFTGANVSALNLGEWVDLAASPGLIALGVATVLALLTRSEFGKHRLRNFWRQYGELPYLGKMSAGSAGLAVLSPRLAEVACIVFVVLIVLIVIRALGPTKVVVSEHFRRD